MRQVQRTPAMRARTLAALLTTIALLLAACGGDGDGAATHDAATNDADSQAIPAAAAGAIATTTNTTAPPAATPRPATAPASTPPTAGRAAQTAAPDPCTLLTTAEVETANGPGLSAGERGRGASFNQCDYTEQATGRQVSVTVDRGAGVREDYDFVRQTFGQAEDLPGVGDRAFYVPSVRVVFALKGDALLSVQILGDMVVGGADIRTRLTNLINRALARV